jgi:hypothetical protein
MLAQSLPTLRPAGMNGSLLLKYPRAFIITKEPSAGWAKAQMSDIINALRFIGVDAARLNFDDVSGTLSQLDEDSYFIVDMNSRVDVAATNGSVRRFSLMVDHPCQLLTAASNFDPRSVTLGWVDQSHVECLAAFGIQTHSVFLPHAGPDVVEKEVAVRDRDIDVLFAGALGEPIDRSTWLEEHPGTPQELADIIFDAAAVLEATLDPALTVFAAICAQHGIKINEAFSREVLCATIVEIIRVAETNRRNAVLNALPNVKICVVSAYMPLKLRDRANIRHVDYIDDFSTIRRLMARSKIILNTTCKFSRGSHERIWYGMAEGAAVLTDASIFMQTSFGHDQSIFYLPQQKMAQDDLAYLRAFIEIPGRLGEIAHCGCDLYTRHHTWKQRISILNDAIQQPVIAAA